MSCYHFAPFPFTLSPYLFSSLMHSLPTQPLGAAVGPLLTGIISSYTGGGEVRAMCQVLLYACWVPYMPFCEGYSFQAPSEHVRTHAHKHTHAHIHTYTHTHIRHTHAHTCTNTHTHTRIDWHTHAHTRHTHAHTHAQTHTCMLSLTHIHIRHTHAHVHMHKFTHACIDWDTHTRHTHAHTHTHACTDTFTHASIHTLVCHIHISHDQSCSIKGAARGRDVRLTALSHNLCVSRAGRMSFIC